MVVQVRARELHDSCHYDFLTRQGTHKMNDVAVVLGVSATDAAALENLMSLAASVGTVKSVVFNVGNNQPMAIADAYWFIHTQPRNTRTFEVDVRPYKEHW
jgi:hypothetical protein